MGKFANFKTIRARILSAFIVVLLFLCVFAGYNFYSNQQMELKAKALVEQDLVILNASKNLATSSSVRLSAALSYVTTGEERYIDIFNDYRQLAEENNAIIEKYYGKEDLARNELVNKARIWSDSVEDEVFTVYQEGKKS